MFSKGPVSRGSGDLRDSRAPPDSGRALSAPKSRAANATAISTAPPTIRTPKRGCFDHGIVLKNSSRGFCGFRGFNASKYWNIKS